MSGARILVVDDDPAILRSLKRALESHGFAVRTAASAADALDCVKDVRPDVVLLDLVLPDGDGISVTREVRALTSAPVILLSAVGDDRTKVAALDEGADDYITKPFNMDEVLARVRVALRRSAGQPVFPVLVGGKVRLDLASRSVTVDRADIHLTPKEYDLLRLLLEHQGRVLTQRYLLSRVWGAEYVDDAHILRTFIHQLRSKLGHEGRAILTDPGVGYRFAPES